MSQRSSQNWEQERERLVHEHLPLVRHVARRFSGLFDDSEDAVQIGVIGLLKAIDRFDPERGFAFSTYAVPLILGEIQRHLRDRGPLRVSRDLQQLARQARAREEELQQELGRPPTLKETAAALDVRLELLIEAMEALRQPLSLEQPHEGKESEAPNLAERIADPKTNFGDILDQITVHQLLASLSERDRDLLRLRFFENQTQQQVAEKLGVSQVQVSRLERKALAHLRTLLQPEAESKSS